LVEQNRSFIKSTVIKGEVMYVKSFKVILSVIGVLLLNSCAGKHVRPPSNYYPAQTEMQNKKIIRVAFDQNGHIYPLSTKDWNWNAKEFQLSKYCQIVGCSYQLRKLHNSNGVPVYNPSKDRNKYTKQLIQDLNKILQNQDKLVIFIHGFNNDYKKAQETYNEFRKKMNNYPILEVYWDGLKKSPPLKIWFSALTYSNLAGQIGLRPIINGINKPIDLVFVTHSRGAAVAISTVSDPIYDSDICAPQEENLSCNDNVCKCEKEDEVCLCKNGKFLGFIKPNFKKIKSLNFVFFAPAIGEGHFWKNMDRYFPDNKIINFYLGTDENDFSTSKSFLSSKAFGDTSLGSDPKTIKKIIKIYSDNNTKINIQDTRFMQEEHGIKDGYFSKENKDRSDCMFWAAGLNRKKPQNCKLIRYDNINSY
jgi:hypothetical protein